MSKGKGNVYLSDVKKTLFWFLLSRPTWLYNIYSLYSYGAKGCMLVSKGSSPWGLLYSLRKPLVHIAAPKIASPHLRIGAMSANRIGSESIGREAGYLALRGSGYSEAGKESF